MRGSIEDMISAMQTRIDELEGGVAAATDIKAADLDNDDEYLERLCVEVENLVTQQYDADVYIDDSSVPEGIVVQFGDGFEFSFPISDIEANWDDLKNDADIIAQDAIEAYEDSME